MSEHRTSLLDYFRLKVFEGSYEYDGNATCAADGMCQEKCPVKINTGEMIKAIRTEQLGSNSTATGTGMFLANNFGVINNTVPTFLNLVHYTHKVSAGAERLMFQS